MFELFIDYFIKSILNLNIFVFITCSCYDVQVGTFEHKKEWKSLNNIIYAGYGQTDLYIPEGTYLAGYHPFRSSRKDTQEQAPIAVRALSVSLQNKTGQNTLLFLSCDFLGLNGVFVHQVKKKIHQNLNIPAHQQIISATHTHSGPDMIGIWGGVSKKLRDKIVSGFLSSARSALDSRVRVSFHAGLYDSHISSVNRRHPDKKLSPNKIGIWSFRKVNAQGASQEFFSTGIFYAAHPVVLGPDNHTPSSDFPGRLLVKAEKKLAHSMIYFNGAIGDVNPPPIDKKNVYNRQGGGKVHLDSFADSILKEVELFLDKTKPVFIDRVILEARDFKTSIQDQFLLSILNRLGFISLNRSSDGFILSRIVKISFSDRIHLITIPGELFKVYEARIYQEKGLSKNIFLMGLAEDSLGYFMNQEEIKKEGGVEETFLLHPQNGDRWYQIALQLLGHLK